jgi:glycosyltransferase involved in cell wall biosynthesis
MVTICFTYFRSLTLANLDAALYSVRQQDLSRVVELVVVDNNADDDARDIQAVIDARRFPLPVRLISRKHGDPAKTHAWSTNLAVREATSPWVLFCRADYLLDFGLVRKGLRVIDAHAEDWDGFVTGCVRHLHVPIARCELTEWREAGTDVLRSQPGRTEDYMAIDSGVWMARRSAFDRVGGLDERLSAWGHAQTDFQHRLHQTGTEFVQMPEVLYYHPRHAAPRDITLAHAQLHSVGGNLSEMWARYHGVSPYPGAL